MYVGEFIYGFDIETSKVIDLLNQLKDSNRLFFALTTYDRGDLEYDLGYTIGNKIVADTKAKESFELVQMFTDLQWFEPKTEEELRLCIESKSMFYAGCVLEEGMDLSDALYTFQFLDKMSVSGQAAPALFIGAKEKMKVKTFMYALEDFQDVQPPGYDSRVWLPKGSQYFEDWAL